MKSRQYLAIFLCALVLISFSFLYWLSSTQTFSSEGEYSSNELAISLYLLFNPDLSKVDLHIEKIKSGRIETYIKNNSNLPIGISHSTLYLEVLKENRWYIVPQTYHEPVVLELIVMPAGERFRTGLDLMNFQTLISGYTYRIRTEILNPENGLPYHSIYTVLEHSELIH